MYLIWKKMYPMKLYECDNIFIDIIEYTGSDFKESFEIRMRFNRKFFIVSRDF